MQAEDWLVDDKWSQAPPEGVLDCGSSATEKSERKTRASSIAEQMEEVKAKIRKFNRYTKKLDSDNLLRILVCEGEPVCCKYVASRSHIVVAGTRDGGVVVWNLREASRGSSAHSVKPSSSSVVTADRKGNVIGIQRPSYNTEGQYTDQKHHASAICKLALMPTATAVGSARGLTAACSVALASVDTSGFVQLWVLTELADADLAAVESDLGMAPLACKVFDARSSRNVRTGDLQANRRQARDLWYTIA
ncbi:MAG: hypothetical protein BJ554DRAFT_5328 [Olpidium bornovanus]|uniref:Uncharacterized protein n=1 Tax=Olpidium bornovanus TaxID=278681 RepID=A0A8H7ZZU2_9FUNG|nr:MAG: hypothetical protein BJ554DRAFT_5328 [Olpidium bornovanus]